MLDAIGLEDDVALLSDLVRLKMKDEQGALGGTIGPEALDLTPENNRQPLGLKQAVAAGEMQAAMPQRAPYMGDALKKARLADADAGLSRGMELAARQAISGLTLQAPPSQKDLVTQPGDAEERARAEMGRTAAEERQRRLDALRQLEIEAGGEEKKLDRELKKKQIENATAALEETRRRNLATETDRDLDREGKSARFASIAAAARAKAEKKAAEAKAKADAKATSQGFKDAAGLRKEYSSLPEVENFKEVETAYGKIQGAASNVSAAGDLSLIFAYMKMLDPGSTVREGEFANAQNAGGVDDKLRAAYNNVTKGQRLDENQRRDFLNQARGLYEAQRAQFDRTTNQFAGLAKKQGLDPADVVFAPAESRTPKSPTPAENPQAAKALEWAKAHPDDPRAVEILKRLGAQ